jgi:hypothetical protein
LPKRAQIYQVPEVMSHMLNERERRIIFARQQDPPVPLSVLAREFGISRQRIAQIEYDARAKTELAAEVIKTWGRSENKTERENAEFLLRTIQGWDIDKFLLRVQRKSSALPPATKGIVQAGAAAWERVKTLKHASFYDWLAVSDALEIGERICIELAGKATGGAYSRFLAAWLDENHMSDITRSTRGLLRDIRKDQTAIEQWRNSLSPERRAKLSHPKTILDAWKAAQQQSS